MSHADKTPASLEVEEHRAGLIQRGADRLAAFIVSLAHAPSGVGDLVRAFITADSPELAIRIVRNSVEGLRKSERDDDYRHRRGFEVVRRVGYVLDAIETIVLPADPALTC